MISKVKAYLNIEPLTSQQVAIGAGAGALAQLAIIWDATTAAVIQLPFFVLTLISMLNWLTGGMNALVERRFTIRGFYKGPMRWMSYVILAVLVANLSILIPQSQLEIDIGVSVITGIYSIAALREADSVIDNLDLPPIVRAAWQRYVKRHKSDDAAESS